MLLGGSRCSLVPPACAFAAQQLPLQRPIKRPPHVPPPTCLSLCLPSPPQGIPVLTLAEAQEALKASLAITVVDNFMPELTPEHFSLVFFVAEKSDCLHESGSGLIATEHGMLAACEHMPPDMARFVKQFFGYQRDCHQCRFPGRELRCGMVVLRKADGYGMQVGRGVVGGTWCCAGLPSCALALTVWLGTRRRWWALRTALP